ncbi:MAG: serine/threonine protein phosphatase [Bacteroidetes bacterium]|nr:serine/threonine protein phosphatase [Bacteroidota bacterium]
MKRTLVIGDIHGGYKALVQLLERCVVAENDTLIFLGDYVDGWSESAKVIDYLMELDKKYACIFIKGNHDQWCEDWLRNNRVDSTWYFHGGQSTINSYKQYSPENQLQHLTFIERMRSYYIDEHKNLFIHAGFSSMHGPAHETYESNYSWDRTLWEMALCLDKTLDKNSPFFPKRLKLFNEIFIGHTPTTNYNIDTPINAMNLWNVDTGMAFTGKLTALDLETKVFWQSDKATDLYPGEKGRNP